MDFLISEPLEEKRKGNTQKVLIGRHTIKQNEFPPGWDEERVQSVISYYGQQTEDEAVAEAEAGLQDESITLMEVPTELVPVILELISKHSTDNLTTGQNKTSNGSTDI